MSKLWIATTDDYLLTLQQHLPPGVIWTRDPDRRLTRFLLGMAAEFTRVHNVVTATMEDADPQTTTALIDEWEHACGLPEFGIFPAGLVNRHRVLVAKLAARGGQSESYFEGLGSRYGHTLDVYDGPWMFYWTVLGEPADMHHFRAGDGCGVPLVQWFSHFQPLPWVFTKYKPSHTAIWWTD